MSKLNKDIVHHFSIRKLTIGTTSIMFGVLIFGFNNTNLVHADVNDSKITDTSQQTQINKAKGDADSKGKLAKSTSNIAKTEDQTKSDVQSSTQNNDVASVKSEQDSEQEQKITFKVPKINSGNKDISSLLKDSKLEQPNADDTEDKNGENSLSVDHKIYDPKKDEKVNITLRLGGTSNVDAPKAGDTYRITIDGGAYNVVNTPDLNGFTGKTTRIDNADGSTTFVEQFNQSEPYTFQFALSRLTSDELENKQLPQFTYGDTLKRITVTKKTKTDVADKPFLHVQFKQHLQASLKPTFRRVLPDSNPDTKLVAGQEYPYEVDVGEADGILGDEFKQFDPLITKNGSITITVPPEFKLDEAATAKKNGNRTDLTIVQTGGKGSPITITYTNSNSEIDPIILYKAQNTGYFIVGFYDMATPAQDVTRQFGVGQTITANTNLNDNQSSLNGKTGPWTDIIMGRTDDQGKPNKGSIKDDLIGGVYTRNGTGYDQIPKGLINGREFNLSEFSLQNISPVDLKNAHIEITIPDGFNCHNFDTHLSDFPDPSIVQYKVTYADGTSKSGKSSDAGLLTSTASSIRKISIFVPELPLGYQTQTEDPELPPDETSSGLLAIGQLADTYDNGDVIKNGDKFNTTMKIWADGTGEKDYSCQQVYGTASGKVFFNTQDMVLSYEPHRQYAGNIQFDMTVTDENLQNAIFYIVLPENASPSESNYYRNGWPWDSKAKTSIFTAADGKKVMRIEYKNGQFDWYPSDSNNCPLELELDNGVPKQKDVTKDFSPYRVYAYLPGATNVTSNEYFDQKLSQVKDSTGLKKDRELSYVQGHDDAYLIYLGSWEVDSRLNYNGSELAEGNQDSSPITTGLSDAKSGDKKMTYYASIGNPTDSNRTNYELVADLPTNGKNGSTFSFNLTGAAKLVDPNTGNAISGAQILYLTKYADVSTEGEIPDISGALTAGQVTNWSKVRAVVVKLGSLSAQTAGRLILKGEDPTLADDNGKVGNLVSYSRSDQVGPFRITEKSGQDQNNLGSYSSIKVVAAKSPETHTKESAHLLYYDDDNSKFIAKNDIGKYVLANSVDGAWQDSIENQDDGTAISFPSTVYNALIGNDYKYIYNGITAEKKNNLKSVDADGTPDTVSFIDYPFGNLDGDSHTDQYFIVHLKKKTVTPPETHTKQSAHLLYYDDDKKQFISKRDDGSYVVTNSVTNAYQDSIEDKDDGTTISFPSVVYDLLTGTDYKYDYVGITAEKKDKLADVDALGTTNSIAFAKYKFGRLDTDRSTDQYFIVHLKKKTVTPPATYTKQSAHLLYYDDYEKKFIIKNNAGKYLLTDSVTSAYHDDFDNKNNGTAISFPATVYNLLTSNDYHYVYAGITAEKKDNLTKVDASGTLDTTDSFVHYPFGKLDTDITTDQYFIVHLNHHHTDFVKDITINETIKYIYGNGPHEGETAHETYHATPITFNVSGYHDDVTDKDVYQSWTPTSASFEEVKSPAIDSYTPDLAKIDAQEVYPDSKDLNFTVKYYTSNPQPTPPAPSPQPSNYTEPSQPSKPTAKPPVPKVPTSKTNVSRPGKPKVPSTGKLPKVKVKVNKPGYNQNNGPHGETNYHSGKFRNHYSNSNVITHNGTTNRDNEINNVRQSNINHNDELPQTSSKQNSFWVALLGASAVAVSLLGLFYKHHID